MASIIKLPIQSAEPNLTAGKVLITDQSYYKHYGIVDRFGMVIHNSKQEGGTVRVSYREFAKNQVVYESKITSANHYQAALKAESYLGKSYNLINFNCEHLVQDSHGNGVKSHQIEKAAVAIIAGLVAWNAPNTTIRVLAGIAGFGALLTLKTEKPIEEIVCSKLDACATHFIDAMKYA